MGVEHSGGSGRTLSRAGERTAGGPPAFAVRVTESAASRGTELHSFMVYWGLKATSQEGKCLKSEPCVGLGSISCLPSTSAAQISCFQTGEWRKAALVESGGSGWAQTSGFKAAGSPGGPRWKASPGRRQPRDETLCWGFKAGQPHNLQKSKPCSLRSLNRPQIKSDPFIFQVLCEKGKQKFCEGAWAVPYRCGGHRNF